jgi:uncharacterized protein (UPF0335 family)
MESIKAGDNTVTEKLQNMLTRIEGLREEKADIGEREKQIFAEAKGAGFDVPMMREILKLRRMELDDLQEFEVLRQKYLVAAGLARVAYVDADAAGDDKDY